jgi:hypothetical protein
MAEEIFTELKSYLKQDKIVRSSKDFRFAQETNSISTQIEQHLLVTFY